MDNQITANEAFNLAKQNQQTVEPPTRLLNEINKRIKEDCSVGKFSTSLHSIDDYGNCARGIGVYLSADMIKKVELYYSKLGFKLGYMLDIVVPQIWLYWGKEAMQK